MTGNGSQALTRRGVFPEAPDSQTIISADPGTGAYTISGAWEKRLDSARWQHDFDLTYRRVG
jgi:hypothetical protein